MSSRVNAIGRTIISFIAILTCLFVVWTSGRISLSRLLSKYSTLFDSLPAAQQAVLLTPSDPEAHRALAFALRYADQRPAAAKAYETAISLRPKDDLLWLDLGTLRDELDDPQGALAAFNESVRAAPYYGHPRWQRGNVLFRLGRYDEAFADLRQAAKSNSALQPNLIDLAWAVSKGDIKLTENILQIDNNGTRVLFAHFLARKGKVEEALQQLRLASTVSDQARNEIVVELLGQKAFRQAFELWSGGASGSHASTAIFDGGFEGILSLDEKTFGWRLARSGDALRLSVDTAQRQSGGKSLLIQFNGNSDPGLSVVSQLVVVEPSHPYRLNFSARTADLVTGGLPIVTITDGIGDRLLGQSERLSAGSNDWQTRSFEFKTDQQTTAVMISVRRENCASSPCPIFGKVWLDSFSIEKL